MKKFTGTPIFIAILISLTLLLAIKQSSNLLMKLKEELNFTYLFITHDLKVVRHICNRIAVMYKGEIVEIGKKEDIINSPEHDYTKQLIESIL